jgi:steroid 5-alpha reductase family enzyme
MSSSSRATIITIAITLVLGALVALAGSQNGSTLGGSVLAGVPLFALAVAAAFAVQVLVYIPSAIARTERFFDLTGGGTFFAVTIALLALVPMADARTWVLAAMVCAWAVRLALFLFLRIHRSGADDRFDDIKGSPLRFLRVWIVQGAWVSITASAAWIAMSSSHREPLGWLSWIGVAVWVVGFSLEVIADGQKSAFKADPANKGRFIASGLWSRSRHPNYFGEILLWIGVFLVAAPVLTGWQWVAVLSPLFVILLLTRVSGIPLLEAKADRTWGGQPEYEDYKASTPVLLPRLR